MEIQEKGIRIPPQKDTGCALGYLRVLYVSPVKVSNSVLILR
jgi:hypothetical protein